MGDHFIEFHNISILISKSKLQVKFTCGYSMKQLVSSSNSTVTVNFTLSTPEASDSTPDYVRRSNYQGMHQLFQKGGESESGDKLCWVCDKTQLLLNGSNVKHAAGDSCQHSGVRSCRLCWPAGSGG